MVYPQTEGKSWALLRGINVWIFVDHPSAFHCSFQSDFELVPATGQGQTFLVSTGGKSQHQTDLFSQVLTHWALQSLGHPRICYPTLLQQDLLNYPACPWTGRAWREASHQLRALLAKSVKQIDFPPRPLGPSEQKETIFHLLFAQRAWSKNLQSGLEDAKCHPLSPTKLLDVAQDSNAAPVAADEGSSVMGLTPLI